MAFEESSLSSSERHSAGNRVSRWWLIPLYVLGALLLLAFLAALAFVWWFNIAKRRAAAELQTEVARIQSAGEPITTEDLYAYHRVSQGKADVTDIWQKALHSFDEKQFNSDSKGVPVIGEDGPVFLSRDDDVGIASADAFLKKYDATIQATLQAARQPGECRFPVKFEAGFTAFLLHAQKMRLLTRLLLLRSRWQTAHEDTDGALESIDAIFAASESLNHQLTLVEHLVRLAIFGVGLHEVERVINETELTEQQIARLQARLETSDLQAGLTRALYGERAMSYLTFHHLESLNKTGVRDNRETVLIAEGKLTRPADCLKSLQLFGDAIEASRAPFFIARQQVEQVEIQLKTMAASRNYLEKFNYAVTLLLFPATRATFDADGINLARREAVLAALAAERQRVKFGSYPSRSVELVPGLLPAIPIDPFDGQPLRFITTDEGLAIYSIGRDGKDDGGIQNTAAGEPDIVVRLRSQKRAEP